MTQMDADTAKQNIQETETPAEAIDITATQDGGITKEIVVQGEGEDHPCDGDKVWVHYIGAFEDMQVFDSSRMRDEQFEFELGKGKVIKAWDIGVATMKRGEKCKLTCKPEYAYGKKGAPPKIPPDTTLIFEIELFDWKGEDLSEDNDGGIMKSILKQGEGWGSPNDGASVKVHYIGKHKDCVFEDREVDFIVGEGCEQAVIEGLEIAVKKFKKCEKSKLTIEPKYAYGSQGNEEFSIPPDATLQYELELKSFEKAKDSWELNTEEKLEQCEIVKAKGTNYFKNQKYKQAVGHYKKILTFLEYEDKLVDDQQKKRDSLMLAAHLNLAMCYLKTADYHEVEQECEKAITLDDNNEKAYFRRGQARLNKNDFELAKEDFQKVLELDKENKAAKNQIILCNQKIKQFQEREKRIYGGMFTKFSDMDKKIEHEDPDKNQSAHKEGPDSDRTSNSETAITAEKESSEGTGDKVQPVDES